MRDQQMPEIPLTELAQVLTPGQFLLVEKIVAGQGKNKGRLRASKPDIPVISTRQGSYCIVNVHDSKASMSAYIWRMVAFQISPIGQHHCMPYTADFGLEVEGYQERRALAKELDKIVEIVVDHVPARQWHGIKRWGEAMGVLGTPRYNEKGETIYRIEEHD